MSVVVPAPLPSEALLQRYAGRHGYTDCFVTELPRIVSQSEFVTAFYTTWLFKCERLILGIAARRPSTDAEAAALGAGTTDRFAAWFVEDRAENQLLLCDFTGRTRSWLMAVPLQDQSGTRLHFGSAVVARLDPETDRPRRSPAFGVLLASHKLYSRQLLTAARRRLLASTAG